MFIEGTKVAVTLPTNLLDAIQEAPPSTWGVQDLEVMLVLHNQSSNPFPGAIGPVVTVEVRRYGSSTQLNLRQLGAGFASQVSLTLPYEQALLSGAVD
eukprot:CAMPEP_0174942700 /NCGR_PEP_ID=MMETSP1355-20121228/74927_1 /TAXON_ID=464990 /ORGANISM="Hemiselmis tepida, Strain CCMP443" /LENGTH=97 /DNA_ID=CAMNT_0016189893 /DNA_START=32 /DNA_END=322 /DNA_ORIENTATION=-